jgi:hypothetical protein
MQRPLPKTGLSVPLHLLLGTALLGACAVPTGPAASPEGPTGGKADSEGTSAKEVNIVHDHMQRWFDNKKLPDSHEDHSGYGELFAALVAEGLAEGSYDVLRFGRTHFDVLVRQDELESGSVELSDTMRVHLDEREFSAELTVFISDPEGTLDTDINGYAHEDSEGYIPEQLTVTVDSVTVSSVCLDPLRAGCGESWTEDDEDREATTPTYRWVGGTLTPRGGEIAQDDINTFRKNLASTPNRIAVLGDASDCNETFSCSADMLVRTDADERGRTISDDESGLIFEITGDPPSADSRTRYHWVGGVLEEELEDYWSESRLQSSLQNPEWLALADESWVYVDLDLEKRTYYPSYGFDAMVAEGAEDLRLDWDGESMTLEITGAPAYPQGF